MRLLYSMVTQSLVELASAGSGGINTPRNFEEMHTSMRIAPWQKTRPFVLTALKQLSFPFDPTMISANWRPGHFGVPVEPVRKRKNKKGDLKLMDVSFFK